VQQLHLVGFTTDLDGLIFSARKGSKSGSFVIKIDDGLLSTIEDAERLRNGEPESADDGEHQRSRQPDRRPRPESTLSPREIQARLRAGDTIAEVAAAAGVGEEWVHRFAVPILAEQHQVIERARQLTFAKARLGESALPLGPSVLWNLADRGVRMTEAAYESAWRAWNLHGAIWIVQYEFVSRQRSQMAEWEVDLREGALHNRNRLAADLGYVEPGRRRRAVPAFEAPERDQPEPDSAGARRPASRGSTGRGSSAKKGAGAKRPAAKRLPAKRSSAAKKSAPAKRASANAPARTPAAKKASAKRRASTPAAVKRTTAKKATVKKKATAKKSSARASGAASRSGAPKQQASAARRSGTASARATGARSAAKATPRPRALKKPAARKAAAGKRAAPAPRTPAVPPPRQVRAAPAEERVSHLARPVVPPSRRGAARDGTVIPARPGPPRPMSGGPAPDPGDTRARRPADESQTRIERVRGRPAMAPTEAPTRSRPPQGPSADRPDRRPIVSVAPRSARGEGRDAAGTNGADDEAPIVIRATGRPPSQPSAAGPPRSAPAGAAAPTGQAPRAMSPTPAQAPALERQTAGDSADGRQGRRGDRLGRPASGRAGQPEVRGEGRGPKTAGRADGLTGRTPTRGDAGGDGRATSESGAKPASMAAASASGPDEHLWHGPGSGEPAPPVRIRADLAAAATARNDEARKGRRSAARERPLKAR
jgi:hypothetical protein